MTGADYFVFTYTSATSYCDDTSTEVASGSWLLDLPQHDRIYEPDLVDEILYRRRKPQAKRVERGMTRPMLEGKQVCWHFLSGVR